MKFRGARTNANCECTCKGSTPSRILFALLENQLATETKILLNAEHFRSSRLRGANVAQLMAISKLNHRERCSEIFPSDEIQLYAVRGTVE